jgi:hypothetical protein
VNSSFEPPIELPSKAVVMRPPKCSDKVAGEKVCDPRARCENRPGGGVQCTCIGVDGETTGLRNRPGEVPDGHECEQVNRIEMMVSFLPAVMVLFAESTSHRCSQRPS